jgi:exodeoxyribonuclease VII large subunit
MLLDLGRRAQRCARAALQEARADLRLAHDRLLSRSPAVEVARLRAELEAAPRRGRAALEQRLRLAREQVRGRQLQLEALSPIRTLERGYAVCTLGSGDVLRSVYQVGADERIDIRVADGQVVSRATARRRAQRPLGRRNGHEGQDAAEPAQL